MKRILGNIIFLFIIQFATAQDTLVIDELVIIDSLELGFNQFNQPSSSIDQVDAIGSTGPLSSSMTYLHGNIRSNGPGKLATMTKHGLPTEHTRVLWNEVELNSPLNGIVDFSTLPTFLLSSRSNIVANEDLDIHFSSSRSEANSFDALLKAGAYGYFNAGLRGNVNMNKTEINAGGQFVQAKNNFSYKNDLGIATKQDHAQFRQYHLQSSAVHQFNAYSKLSFFGLASKVNTDIPPTIFQSTSDASQESNSIKSSLQFAHRKNNQRFDVIYGINSEKLHYINPSIDIDAEHDFIQQQIKTKWNRFINHRTNIGASFRGLLEQGRSDNFIKSQFQGQVNLSGHIQQVVLNSLVVGLEGGFIYGRSTTAPLQYKVKLTQAIRSNSRLAFSIESRYRLPTYNELFWTPGGNEDLRPENGHALVLDFFHSLKRFRFNVGGSYHQLKNRILWLPDASSTFSPINIGKIRSQEVYGGVQWTKQVDHYQIRSQLRYTYLHAFNANESQTNYKRDLPYNPRQILTLNAQFTYKSKLSLLFNSKYQSKTYTNVANTNELDDYFIAQFEARYLLEFKSKKLQLFGKLNNITNATYYLSSGFPQPPRHWQIGLILKN